MREQDLAGSFGGWFLPGTCERPIIRGIGWFVCVFRFESNDQPVLVHNCLCIQKFRSRRPGSGAKSDRTCSRNSAFTRRNECDGSNR